MTMTIREQYETVNRYARSQKWQGAYQIPSKYESQFQQSGIPMQLVTHIVALKTARSENEMFNMLSDERESATEPSYDECTCWHEEDEDELEECEDGSGCKEFATYFTDNHEKFVRSAFVSEIGYRFFNQ
jgi:hypothetical protein